MTKRAGEAERLLQRLAALLAQSRALGLSVQAEQIELCAHLHEDKHGMDETCEREARRLLQITAALRAETTTLGHKPFDQAEHDSLNSRLRTHQHDLAEYRRWCLTPTNP